MKTLLQAAIEFEESQGGREIHKAFWSDERGAPFLMVSARSAFMAGAAAMAELFAQGQALKIERSPGRYYIEISSQRKEGERHRYIRTSYIIQSYFMDEAIKQAEYRFINVRGGEYHTIREARAALDSDTEEEKEIV